MATTSTSERQPVSPSLLGAAPEDLYLRVRGGHEEPTIRLTSAKCTVGAADGCTLRLRSPGVKPVHCLILRGKSGTVVRRMSSDTRLNGRVFSDAPLYPGDCLGIGPLEFEILANPAQRAATNRCQTQSKPSNAGGRPEKRVSTEGPRVHAELLERIKTVRGHARTRVGRLVRQIRAMRYELADMQSRARSSQADAAASQQKVAELSSLARQLRAEIVKADEERRAQVGEIERLSADAAQLRAELDQQRQVNAEQKAKWDVERTRLTDEISDLTVRAERSEAAAASREEIDAMTADWRKEREAAESELESLRKQIEVISDELQQRTCDLEAEQKARAEEQASREMVVNDDRQTLISEREQLEKQRGDLTDQVDRLDQQKQQLEADRVELTETINRFDQERQAWELQQTELAQQVDEFGQQKQDWEAQRTELEEQIAVREQELAAEREQWEQENAERTAELARQEEELAIRQQQLESQTDQQQAALDEAEQQLGNTADSEDLSQERERLQAEWAQLGRELEQLEEERREWRQRRDEQAADLDPQVAVSAVVETKTPEEPVDSEPAVASSEDSIFDLVNQNLAAARSASEAGTDEPMESGAETHAGTNDSLDPSDDAAPQADAEAQGDPANLQETVQDVLARLGCGVDWDSAADSPQDRDTGEAEADSAPSQPEAGFAGLAPSGEFESPAVSGGEEPAFDAPQAEEPAEATAGFSGLTSPAKVASNGFEVAQQPNEANCGGDEEDDSINAYMENLMKRMRGGADDAPGGENGFTPVPSWRPPEKAQEEVPEETSEQPTSFADPSDYRPANTAPEKADSLAAMREIANSTTRTAIHNHTFSRAGQLANGKLLIALVGVVCGAVLLFTSQGQDLKFLAGAVGLLVAVFWGLQAVRLKRGSQFERQITTDQIAAPRVQSPLGALEDDAETA
jgi:hypothetical protein